MNRFKINKTLLFFMLTGLFLTQPITANAQYYGNDSVSPVIVVDKKIKLPSSEKLLDNVSQEDYLFKEGDQIEFAISIENRGSVAVYDLNVIDKLPEYLKVQYYFGKLDTSKSNIETVISVLRPGEVKKYSVIALINGLPNSNYIKSLKQINNVCARNNQISDCDNSTYYAGVKTMPVTGSSTSLMISSLLLMSLTGSVLTLRRLIRGY